MLTRLGVCAGLCFGATACAGVSLDQLQSSAENAFGLSERSEETSGGAEAAAESYAPREQWVRASDDEALLKAADAHEAAAATEAADAAPASASVAAEEAPVIETVAAAPTPEREPEPKRRGGLSTLFGLLSSDDDETVAEARDETRASAPTNAELSEIVASASREAEQRSEPRPVQAAAASDVSRTRARARTLTSQRMHQEAAAAWREVMAAGGGAQDQMSLAASLVRSNQWDEARQTLETMADARSSERGLMLLAITYDQSNDWRQADSAYADALAISKTPHLILNNWGVSAMARGEHKAAADLFTRALRHRPDFANAKANLALVRGLGGDYSLPAVDFTEVEKAEVLHDLGLIAFRRGDLDEAAARFQAALETHPRYYRKAADMLLRIEKKRGGVREL